MRKIVFVLVFLVVLCSCAREKAPEIPVIVPVPEPVPLPPPEPIVIEPMPQPEPAPDIDIKEPEPVPVIPGRPSCRILKDQGLVYTLADVAQGKISAMNYDDLRVCYPYFDPDSANSESKCCII